MIEGDVSRLLHQRSDVQTALAYGCRNLGKGQFATGVLKDEVGHRSSRKTHAGSPLSR